MSTLARLFTRSVCFGALSLLFQTLPAEAQLPPPPPGAYDAAPYLGEIRNRYVYGDIWERPGLSPRDRSLITVAVTQALNAPSELQLHMGRGLDNGLRPAEIEEIIAHVQWFRQLPAEVDGLRVAADLFAARGLSSPLASAAADARAAALQPFPTSAELGPRDRSLITVALASTLYASTTLRAEVPRALDNGVTQSELAELITHIAFYGGFPSAVNASRITAEVLTARGLPSGESRFPGAPYLETLIDGLVFGESWTRLPLTPRERSVATIAVTLAGYQSEQLRTHLGRGLDNGLSVQEIAELIAHATLYAGFPRGINASRIYADLLRERGLETPGGDY
jgi:alkylhydroperoxidase/carboxymuconolactone decarboxylase family protein YurZ